MVRSSRVLSLSPQAMLVAAVAVMTLPLRWMTAWLAVAAVHELGHILAVMVCKGRITGIQIGLSGAVIQADGLNPISGVICSLAGPVAGGTLILLSSAFPRLAICALLQTVYNLLPIYPLDCGRALKAAYGILCRPKTAGMLMTITECVVLLALSVGALYAAFILQVGWVPIFVLLVFLVKNKKIKIPCKRSRHRVQ